MTLYITTSKVRYSGFIAAHRLQYNNLEFSLFREVECQVI